MNKRELRKEMIIVRNKVRQKSKKDVAIFENLKNLDVFNDAESVFIYISTENEVNTIKIIKWCIKNNKRVFVPRIIKGKGAMEAIEIKHLLHLRKNNFGILEPVAGVGVFNASGIDLVIMPGIAFDKNGGRIGYGGGYYDRFLQKDCDGEIIALAYEDQVIEHIPMDNHDIRVQKLITETNLYIMEKIVDLIGD